MPSDDFLPDDPDEFEPEPHNTDVARDAYEKGMHAYNNDDMETARGFFQSAMTLNPNMMEAKDALERMPFTQTESSEDPSTIETYRRGYQQYIGGDFGGAKRTWADLLRKDPKSFEAREGLDRITAKGAM